jgi:adenylate cyclase
MEQLTLFSHHATVRRRHTPSTNRRNKLKTAPGSWDLWTQHDEDAHKQMVLFFLDIRNFTPLAEKHDAAQLLHIVKKIFSICQTIIQAYHGRIIETTGDGFYAAFEIRTGLSDAVRDAIGAADAILLALKKKNESSFEKNLQQRIAVGIGLHCGEVATGSLNVGGKDHFVVMGHAVNVAARIQSATKEFNNNFIVSSSIANALPERCRNADFVTAHLKGVSEAMELCLLGSRY